MILAVAFAAAIVVVGGAAIHAVGVHRPAQALAVSPAAGAAVVIVSATWLGLARVPAPWAGSVLASMALIGTGFVVRAVSRHPHGTLWRHWRDIAMIGLAIGLPAVVTTVALGDAQVPLSPHDGATHVEMSDAFRTGLPQATWYPPGLSATFGLVLELLPNVDTARGTLLLGAGLPILATAATAGLGWAMWRTAPVGAAGAVMLGLTYLYPYFPQIWSGWPLAISVVLVLGLWTVALEYVRDPHPRWALVAGVLLGAIVLSHGTELYTSALVLLIVLITAGRHLHPAALMRDVALTGLVAALSSAVYIPTLLGWAARGGATEVALPSGIETAGTTTTIVDALSLFTIDALGTDLPIRVVLVGIGLWWSIANRQNATPIIFGATFAALTAVFSTFSGSGPVRQIYAALFPWPMNYRLLMAVGIAQAFLAGAGAVALWQPIRRLRACSESRWKPHVWRLSVVLTGTWGILTVWGTILLVGYSTDLVVGYSHDDDPAMAWLHAHVASGEVVVNDGFADAGIWAPYKAGVEILIYRSPANDPERWAVVRNIARLDQDPATRAAACRFRARYAYYGAKTSSWQDREMPPLDDLQRSASLDEVFASGGAHVFALKSLC